MASTDSIASLIVGQGQAEAEGLRERGRIRAEEALRKRAFWGNTLRDIAGLALQIPQQIAAAREAKSQAQLRDLQVQQAQQQAADLKALDVAFQQPGGRDKILDMLPGHLKPKAAQQFIEMDEANDKRRSAAEKLREAEDNTIARAARIVKEHDYEPMAAQGMLSTLKGYYRDDPQRLQAFQQLEEQLHANPTKDFVRPLVDGLIKSSPEQGKLAIEEQQASTQTKTAETSAARLTAELPGIAARAQQTQQEVAGTVPMTPAQQAQMAATERLRTETERHNRVTEAEARRRLEQDEAAPTLSPEGLDAVALSFAKTGQLPPMGMGKKAAELRTQIINRAAQMNPSLDLASNRAAFQANEGALKALQKQRDAIGAFEQTATKNIDLFLDQAGKVVDTGSPLANALVRNVSGSVLGSPNVAAFNAARQVAINEIAKITSNPNLSGQLSDTARKEVEAFNPSSATLKQSVAVMRLLKQDMKNRTGALDDQIDAIKSRISGKGSARTSEDVKVGGFTVREKK